MPDWPGSGGFDRVSRALTVGDSFNKGALGATNGANSKGNWVTVLDPVPFDASGFFLMTCNNTGSPWSGLLDIGIGPAGSEQVILPNVLLVPTLNDTLGEFWYVPLALPAGARVAARGQANNGSFNPGGEVVPIAGGFTNGRGCQRAYAFGINETNSVGTAIEGNYPGGWVAVADNVPELAWLMVAAYMQQTSGNHWMANYEVAISAAGAGSPERIVLPSIPVLARPSQVATRWSAGAFPVRVPPGSKLWARQNNVGYSSQIIRLGLYGFI